MRLLSEQNCVVRLIDAVTEIGRNSEIYQSNAARDYESYYRDLEVYYKVIVSQLELIDNSFKALTESKATLLVLVDTPFNLNSKEDSKQLIDQIQKSSDEWKTFQLGLTEKFGDNAAEPRLEWGAEFIVANVETLNFTLAQMGKQFSKISEKQLTLARRGAQIELYSIVLFIISLAVFFYFRISNPINNTKKAFLRVSNGDFGHQINNKYNNEVGELVTSFNEMSARSQTVLSILAQLQTARTTEQVLQLLYENISNYTGCELVAMVNKK